MRRGEILGVVGGSGTGKSVLMRSIVGLQSPAAGEIEVFGEPTIGRDETEAVEIRKRWGVLFQGGALFSSMTVAENLLLPLRELTRLDPRTMEIMVRMKLEAVGLAGFEQLVPAQLSGGMAKRAALARAIVMDPRILFCDEPSAGLDPAVAAALDELLLALRDAMNMSIVVVTHELASAFRIADRIAVLHAGRIVAEGTPDEIRAHDHAQVRALVERRPEPPPADPAHYLERLAGGAAAGAGERP